MVNGLKIKFDGGKLARESGFNTIIRIKHHPKRVNLNSGMKTTAG